MVCWKYRVCRLLINTVVCIKHHWTFIVHSQSLFYQILIVTVGQCQCEGKNLLKMIYSCISLVMKADVCESYHWFIVVTFSSKLVIQSNWVYSWKFQVKEKREREKTNLIFWENKRTNFRTIHICINSVTCLKSTKTLYEIMGKPCSALTLCWNVSSQSWTKPGK